MNSVEPSPSFESKPATAYDLKKVQDEMSGFERSTIRWTRAGFFIVLATAVFIGLQWHEMNAGGADTHTLAEAAKKQADKSETISDSINKAVIALQTSNTQAKDALDKTTKENHRALAATLSQGRKALDASIASFHLDQRPWVFARSFVLSAEPEADKPVSVKILMANSGKTPAIDVIPESQIAVQFTCEDLRPVEVLPEVKSHGVLPPGQSDFSFSTGSLTPSHPIAYAYGGGTTRLFVQGLIRYTDAFRVPHWTRFRVFHEHGTAPNEWQYCEGGNDVDH